MLEKIFNSMIYGNAKTKLFLWSVVILGLGAVFLLMAGIVLGIPSMGIGGVMVGLLGLIVSQSVSLKDLQKEKKGKKGKKTAKESMTGAVDGAAEKKEQEAGEAEGKTRRQREKEKAQYLSSMNQKKLKKTMKEHKVNQIHVKVMIDSYPAKKIEQAPAFMWRTDTMLHFMILNGKAEEFEVPLSEIKGILLVKDVPANKDKDYSFFRYSSFISGMFQPYLPEYFESTKDGTLQVKKNTFRIEPGIYLTNSSVANLRRVLLPGVAFLVDDAVIASDRFNEYFKELYRQSLLCKNLVITLDEYKGQIKRVMDDLLQAPISGKEFVTTVYDLKKYRLITPNDAAVYTQKYKESRE